MRKLLSSVILIIVLVLAAVFGALFYLNSQNPFAAEIEPITIGNAQSFECDTLVHISEDQNFFAENGLNVTIRDYTSGMEAVNALLKGEVDVAATAEFPLVAKAFNGQNISALATIAKTQLQDIICRKDRGIEKVPAHFGAREGPGKMAGEIPQLIAREGVRSIAWRH